MFFNLISISGICHVCGITADKNFTAFSFTDKRTKKPVIYCNECLREVVVEITKHVTILQNLQPFNIHSYVNETYMRDILLSQIFSFVFFFSKTPRLVQC